MTLTQAIEALRKYSYGLKLMSGGFTLSGGEPLLQDRFAVKLLGAAREMGIHTALDTNGYLGERLSDGELDAIRLYILDIKTWDRERHRRLTGMDIEPVLQFARRLSRHKKSVWLRFVLVPGLTDNVEDVGNIADFAAGLGVVERVDVLPFHQMGRFKWKALGLKYELDKANPPSAGLVEKVCSRFRESGLIAY